MAARLVVIGTRRKMAAEHEIEFLMSFGAARHCGVLTAVTGLEDELCLIFCPLSNHP